MTELEDRIHKVTIVLEEERARKAEVGENNMMERVFAHMTVKYLFE